MNAATVLFGAVLCAGAPLLVRAMTAAARSEQADRERGDGDG